MIEFSTAIAAAAAIALAFLLDWTVGEPPRTLHPVAWFGRAIAPLDREWHRPTLVGTLALLLPVGAGAVVWAVVAAVPTPVDAVVAGVVLFVTFSRRMLLSEARVVITASERDATVARERLPALAGRDPEPLSPKQLQSAAVESAAENLADGLVAPLAAFALGVLVSLPIAAAAAAWVKGVNTLDSMLGYRAKPVGGPSARLDDLVMALPARASALTIAVAAVDPDAIRRGVRWARVPDSPNAGWPMGTLAAAADIRLEKPGAYVLNADGAEPDADLALDCLAVVDRAALVSVLLAGGWSVGLGGVLG